MRTTSIITNVTSKPVELPMMSRELKDKFAEDIKKRNCIYPIVVTPEGEIIDGRIRAEICESLGIKPKKIIVSSLSKKEREEWRIALNLHRRHLSREQVRELIARLLILTPHVSDRSIAATVGVSPTTVGKVRATVQPEQSTPRLGRDGKYRKPIIYTASEVQAKEASRLMQSTNLPSKDINLRTARTLKYEQDRSTKLKDSRPTTHKDFIIHHCDFRQAAIKPNSVDLFVLDPPWAEWERMAEDLGKAVMKFLKPNGIACLYSGVGTSDGWNDAFRVAGLTKVWQVVSIHRDNGGSIIHGGAIRHRYTPILIYRKTPKGRFKTNGMMIDVFEPRAAEKDYHEWQQPVAESETLIRCLSDPGALVADLTSGSGTSGIATIRVGEGRKWVGCEIDEKHVQMSRLRISDELKSKT
jgi:DNA methylase/ParB-like nuclease domain